MKTLTIRNLLASLFIMITLISCENTSGISNSSTISNSATSICNSAVLNVTNLPQKKNLWCWAASMEMVMKYHIPSSKQQYELVQDYYKVFNNVTKTDCFLRECDPNPNDLTINCVKSIRTFQPKLLITPSYTQWFNVLFLHNNWISIEDPDISWERLKSEINSCRPLILVRDTITSSTSSSIVIHAVVAKGFIECSDGTKKVIVNDPFEVCVGHEDYLSYPFEIPNSNYPTGKKKTVIESIYYINPKSNFNCALCNDTNKTNPVSETVITNLRKGIKMFTTNNTLSIQNYIATINKDSQNNIIPVKRLSFNKVSQYYKYPNIDSNAFNGNIRLSNIYDGIESVDIVPKSIDNPLLFRMTKSENGFQNEKVSPFIPYDFNKIKSYANSLNATNYYLVESYFLGIDFFVFETLTGIFISKAARGMKYELTNPIEESTFWKLNEKNIFPPIFL